MNERQLHETKTTGQTMSTQSVGWNVRGGRGERIQEGPAGQVVVGIAYCQPFVAEDSADEQKRTCMPTQMPK